MMTVTSPEVTVLFGHPRTEVSSSSSSSSFDPAAMSSLSLSASPPTTARRRTEEEHQRQQRRQERERKRCLRTFLADDSIRLLSLRLLLLSLLLALAAHAASSSSSSSSSSHHHRGTGRSGGRPHRTARPSQDYYECLGADRRCTPEQLKKCYRKACLRHHPDKGGSEDEFKKVARAYQVLSDPNQRKLYDALGEAGLEQQQAGGGAGTSTKNPFTGGSSAPFGQGSPFASFHFGTSNGGGVPPFTASSSSYFRPQGGGGGGAGGAGANLNVEDLLRQFMVGGQSGVGGGFMGDAFFPDEGRRKHPPSPTTTYERPVHCTLEELYHGATKKLKVTFDKNKSKLYRLDIRPGYKAGTKLTFPATASSPQLVWVLKEKPHPVFARRGHDLVYKYKLPHDNTNSQNGSGRISLSIPLLDGTTWTRDIDARLSVVRRGSSITVPNLGMPIRMGRRSSKNNNKTTKNQDDRQGGDRHQGDGTRGNLIIEFE